MTLVESAPPVPSVPPEALSNAPATGGRCAVKEGRGRECSTGVGASSRADQPSTSGQPAALVPSIATRCQWLAAFAAGVRARHAELTAVVADEIGKPAWETTLTEILPLLASLDWHRRSLLSLLRPRRLGGGAWWQWGDSLRRERVPVGRVLIIATWNYPLQLLGIQLAQSIAAGNETWVKPSERSPRSQALLLAIASEALRSAGLDPRMVTVAAATRDEGERLVREERFDHILFTGSTAVGRAIASAAAATLTPTTLELSGQDSAIVCADADLRHAARSIWQGVTMNAGQTCMAPRRAIVAASAYRGFLDALAPIVAGAPSARLIDAAAAARCHALAADALTRGGRSLSGVLEGPRGALLRPTAIVDVPVESPLFEGDHFGPVLAVTPVADLDEAIALHRGVGSALATSVYTSSPNAIGRRAADFGSSFVTINDCVRPTAHPAASIIGRGPSGWGASRGLSGLLSLTHEITISTRGRFSPPPEAPSPRLLAWIRRMTGLHGSSQRATPDSNESSSS